MGDGRFKKGQKPWNLGKKCSLKTREKIRKKLLGHRAIHYAEMGTIRIRKNKKLKDTRRWIKIKEGKWILYSNYLWKKHKGPIPKGMIIHHKDHDTLNDKIENYELMNRAAHLNHHREKIREKFK